MNVLLLGGAGYLGRMVAERLFDNHHRLHVVDLFAFSPAAEVAEIATVERRDTRRLEAADFTDVDVVFDLVALPHDPAGALDPTLTEAVNVDARRHAAALTKRMGVRHYVLFSSCAVYGATAAVVDETAPLDPPTVDAAADARAEAAVLGLADSGFGVTVFRLATVFGPSPGMRFDLVVNTMALDAFRHGPLQNYDGTALIVSHDRYFISKVATKIVEISEGELVVYEGDYHYYLDKKEEAAQAARLAEERAQAEAKRQAKKEKEKQKEKERKAAKKTKKGK